MRLTTLGRARVWRLYMAASALAFEENRIGVNQILAVRTGPDGDSAMPAVRAEWLGFQAADAAVGRVPEPAPRQPDGPFGTPPNSAEILPR